MGDNKNSEQVVIDQELTDKTIGEICGILAQIEDKQFIFDFFKCLFTPAEMKDFTARWLLVNEIDAGTTQREIARKFGMSLCKITRGSRELSKPDSAFRKMIDYGKSHPESKK